jgi:hypothetical protein
MDFNPLNILAEPELKTRLETASRVGAILLVIVYVFGFVAVTFANSSRGIINFSLFRTKVLAAGFLFSVFLAFPLLDWSRVFGKLGFPPNQDATLREGVVSRRTKVYSGSRRLLFFFMASIAMAGLFCLFIFVRIPHGRFVALYLGFIAAGVAVLMICDSQSPRHPLACASLCLALTALGVAGLILVKDQTAARMIGWFFLVAFAAHYIEKDFREAQHPRNITWHWILIYAVMALAYFGTQLYPMIPPHLGGGEPTHAIFQFANASPVDGSSKDEVWLLDEVDAGYYVLRTPGEHKAIFLPRSLVSAIYFDAGGDTASTQP